MITIPGMVAALASAPATASRVAVHGDRTRTYAELAERGRRRSVELAAAGVGAGDIVALVTFNEPEVYETLLAAGHLGAALMPLSPALTDRELAALIDKADPALCLTSPAVEESRRSALAEACGREVHGLAEPAAEDPRDAPFPAPDAAAWISTTGGSTGTPRLFAMSHERLLGNLLLDALEWDWRRYPAHLAIAPLAHGIGFTHSLGALVTGCTVVLVERYSAGEALERATASAPVWTALVPTMLHDLVEAAGGRLDPFGLVVTAGAPLPARLRERALAAGPRLVEYYGSTELGWVTWIEHRPGDPRDGLVGRPVLGSELRIVDRDGREVPPGEVGLVEKRGRPYAVPLGGAAAYQAKASAWEGSGDLGRIDPDGCLVLAGRADDMLVVGGQNVYPAEVEAVLRGHPAVREVVVRGEDDDRLGRRVVAVVEADGAGPELESELRDYAAGRLAKHKRPSRFVVLAALPRNSSGKVSRSFPLPPVTVPEDSTS